MHTAIRRGDVIAERRLVFEATERRTRGASVKIERPSTSRSQRKRLVSEVAIWSGRFASHCRYTQHSVAGQHGNRRSPPLFWHSDIFLDVIHLENRQRP